MNYKSTSDGNHSHPSRGKDTLTCLGLYFQLHFENDLAASSCRMSGRGDWEHSRRNPVQNTKNAT